MNIGGLFLKGDPMSQGDKTAYTKKQKPKAHPIKKTYREKGRSESEAEKIAGATVNKVDGGGNRSGSGRTESTSSSQ
jgi:uncharacterized membrane-anchored protein